MCSRCAAEVRRGADVCNSMAGVGMLLIQDRKQAVQVGLLLLEEDTHLHETMSELEA
jgi:hypothetical protein